MAYTPTYPAKNRSKDPARNDGLRKANGTGQVASTAEPKSLAFALYCVFIVSYFLHLGARVSVLGTLRFDLLLAGLTIVLAFLERNDAGPKHEMSLNTKLLLAIAVYVVVSIPFVEWPGTVIRKGWEPFVKSLFFYFFTVAVVRTETRLKQFFVVFIAVQMFRVLEPLYMHFTTGYWGSFTHMGNFEFMNRLSGSPFDIINPNGLAFVILIVTCLTHYLLGAGSNKQKMIYVGIMVPLLYAMSLTGSRSGMLVLAIFALLVIWRSKHRVAAFTAVGVIVMVLVATMDDLERQRYLSIVDKNAKGAATSQGRVDGIWIDVGVGLERPIFGHGLGTSAEANAHAYGKFMPSHTLYTEVLQELGLIGLGIFLAFMYYTWKNCTEAVKRAEQLGPGFLLRASRGIRDLAILLGFFSIASYGLNEYQWYLLAGLSVATCRILQTALAAAQGPASGQGSQPLPVENKSAAMPSPRASLWRRRK